MKVGRALAITAATAAAAILVSRLRPGSGPAADAPLAEPRAVSRLAAWRPVAPESTAGRLAGYLWAAPLTLAGLLLGGLSGTRPRVQDGALLYTGVRGLTGAMLRWRGFSAATLGHVILAEGEPSAQLLRHELVHVRQAERWGPLFAPLYLAALVRYGYRQNPFERAAYATNGRADV